MRQRAVFRYLVVGIPPLALAAVGITHPLHLTASAAEYWRNLHVLTLVLFPLLGFAPWLIVRGWMPLLTWIVGVLGFVYASFYTVLDVLAGIGAGGLKLDDMGMATGVLFGLANSLGAIGSYALVIASVVAGAYALWRARLAALPGTILVVVGSVLFLERHIFFPVGVIGQLCLAVGWCALVFALERALRTVSPGPAASTRR